MSESADKLAAEMSVYNYCVCFLDILGQQHALRNQGLLPQVKNEEERLKFVREVLATTIRPITRLQKMTRDMMEALSKRDDSPIRNKLPPEMHEQWDKLQEQNLSVQYWSDGLVIFSCLGNQTAHAQINGAYSLIALAGSLCFTNLGDQFRNPLRGGIEIAWGAELRKGELYGPAIARAYELESQVAQYPRIAVGSRMIEFLKTVASLEPVDDFSKYSASIATLCLKMILKDVDGQWMIHYLGETFQESVTQGQHAEMYADALKFISEEYSRFREQGDSKLANRYFHLFSYFRNYPPKH